MKKGYLSEYFVGVAAKILSAVEVDSGKSNQHEFNGVSNLKKIFGTEKKTFNTTFIYFGDNDDEPVIDEGKLTWYDARKDHPTRTEFRMYFTSSPVLSCTETGDGMFIALRFNDQVLVIVTENKFTIFNQLSGGRLLILFPHPKSSLFPLLIFCIRLSFLLNAVVLNLRYDSIFLSFFYQQAVFPH